MGTTILRSIIAAALAVSLGCSGGGSDGDAPGVDPPAPSYDGPPFSFDVAAEGGATEFRWAVTVPTGGWELRFDGARTKPPVGHAEIRVRLVRPGPDEMVTQALETLEGEYRHENLTATSAEFLVEVVTRGEDVGDGFRRAATWNADG